MQGEQNGGGSPDSDHEGDSDGEDSGSPPDGVGPNGSNGYLFLGPNGMTNPATDTSSLSQLADLAWSSTSQDVSRAANGSGIGNGDTFGFPAPGVEQPVINPADFYVPDRYSSDVQDTLRGPGILVAAHISDLEAGATSWALVGNTGSEPRSLGSGASCSALSTESHAGPSSESGLNAPITQFGSWVSFNISLSYRLRPSW